MNPEELAAIKARVVAASDGPWKAIPDPAYGDHGYLLAVGPVWPLSGGTLDLKVGDDDATFIVHAREDVPALVAEVERLREALRTIGEDVLSDTDDWMIRHIGDLVDGALAEGAA
jgi:hypothetical protein